MVSGIYRYSKNIGLAGFFLLLPAWYFGKIEIELMKNASVNFLNCELSYISVTLSFSPK